MEIHLNQRALQTVVTFGTETIVATSDAGSYVFLSSDNDGASNYYFSWLEIPVSSQRKFFCTKWILK